MPDAGPVAVADVDQDTVDYVSQVEDDVSQVAPVLEIALTDVIDEEEACPSAEVVEVIDIDAAPVEDADQDAADYVAQVEDDVAPVPVIDVVDEEEASPSAEVVEVMIDADAEETADPEDALVIDPLVKEDDCASKTVGSQSKSKDAAKHKMKPELQINDHRTKFLADTDARATNVHPKETKFKSGREIREAGNKQEREKERKLVNKRLAIKEKEIVTKLINSTADKEVVSILQLYSVSDKDINNINKMLDYSRMKLPLQTTFRYVMKGHADPTMSRRDLAEQIVVRLSDMLPLHCQKCSELYCPIDQATTPVKCFKCETVPHSSCMKEEVQRLDADRGYVWLCYQCEMKPLPAKSKKYKFMDSHTKGICKSILGALLGQLRDHHAAKAVVGAYSLDLTDSFNATMMVKNRDRVMIERAYQSMMNLHCTQTPESNKVKAALKTWLNV